MVALQVLGVAAMAACVCQDMSLCKPLRTPKAKKEVVAFAPTSDDWKTFNMSSLTTVMKFSSLNDDLVCAAHAAGVRVVVNSGFDKTQLGNATAVQEFISQTVSTVKEGGYDGYNFDVEGLTTDRDLLTSLVEKTAAALRADNPIAQVTFDTSISASKAGYDYIALNRTLDFFIPMAYDMCWGSHTAKPNSPMSGILSGLQDYNEMGLLDQVVLGLPWYGYRFPCVKPAPEGGCTSSQPFSGSWAYTFFEADALQANATTPPAYTAAQDARFFSYVSGGTTYQLYYDDAHTLSKKYALVKSKGLKGAAVWYAGCANPSTSGGAAMWTALEGIKEQ
eukprot:TRINITY_DN37581_c0_g1_i1.p1 TRINITY_DN37581_c0_g1~~TRINITY_DN37581_c0_g1_i1.p1  ORF type:complete len:335 (+),score=87.02 TRINITY_DN37581_c0_g1_i1:46-1050(+)